MYLHEAIITIQIMHVPIPHKVSLGSLQPIPGPPFVMPVRAGVRQRGGATLCTVAQWIVNGKESVLAKALL